MNGLSPLPLLVSMPFVLWLCSSSHGTGNSTSSYLEPGLGHVLWPEWDGTDRCVSTEKPEPREAFMWLLVISYFCHCHDKHVPVACCSQEKNKRRIEQAEAPPNKLKLDQPSLTQEGAQQGATEPCRCRSRMSIGMPLRCYVCLLCDNCMVISNYYTDFHNINWY